MNEADPTTPRKSPVQERARHTVDAIIDAAAHILATDGVEALNTNRIAEVAGVSIGSLYQYFPNKKSIVAALVELELARDLELAEQAFESLRREPLLGAIEQLCALAVFRARSVQKLHETLLPLVEEVGRQGHVRGEVASLEAEIVEIFWARREELPQRVARDRETLADTLWLLFRMVEDSVNRAKVERSSLLEGDLLTDVMVAAIRAALTPKESPGIE